MKINKNILYGFVLVTSATIGLSSCTDTIAFGSSFLDKAAGASVTADTVFNNAEYTRQFLTGVYTKQFYGLPYRSSTDSPRSSSYWTGMIDNLSDCYQLHAEGTMIYNHYYSGTFNAGTGAGVYGFLTEDVWEMVRAAYLLIENINKTPGMEDSEKARMIAEAKCLIASGYFNMFRFYGGLPLITNSFTGTEASYNCPRASVEKTVNFMVGLLDEAIADSNFPWGYTGTDAQTYTGRWTKAGAMALKCKVLQFAASPLFNDTEAYYGGSTEAEKDSLVWYGGYKKELWTQCRQACADFFTQLGANGIYSLTQPTAATPAAYRYAYRYGYMSEYSTEILHTVRVSSSTRDSKYQWNNLNYGKNSRYSNCATQEYIEMFPWSDGTPFDWNAAQKAGKLDQMFVKGDTTSGKQDLQNRVLTRDPRLYETVRVNGVPQTIQETNGNVSGNIFEMWVGGSDAGTGPSTESGFYSTGYGNNKYYAGDLYYTTKHYPQWDALRLSDMYLTYAEALLQADNNFTDAISNVDIVRARVGLGGLVACNPNKQLTTNKDSLIEQILRERACEFGLEGSRYYDMVRYKRSDLFEKQLHGLHIYRLRKVDGVWTRVNSISGATTAWWNGDKKTDKSDKTAAGFYEPTHFEFEKFTIANRARVWWDGFDKKWFLEPFPTTEINKNYGLIQNPGW